MHGVAYVNNKPVMESTMLAQIIKVKNAPSPVSAPVNPN
jgi:hypothetical protein